MERVSLTGGFLYEVDKVDDVDEEVTGLVQSGRKRALLLGVDMSLVDRVDRVEQEGWGTSDEMI